MKRIEINIINEKCKTLYIKKYSLSAAGIKIINQDNTIRFIPWANIKECFIKEE